jgi:hypothetical protein
VPARLPIIVTIIIRSSGIIFALERAITRGSGIAGTCFIGVMATGVITSHERERTSSSISRCNARNHKSERCRSIDHARALATQWIVATSDCIRNPGGDKCFGHDFNM